MRLLVTGGSGVLGRALLPLASSRGHEVQAPSRAALNLFDVEAVTEALAGMDAVLHLATRIRALSEIDNAHAWSENDRLRGEASKNVVTAGLAGSVEAYVQPTVTFVYPPDQRVDEATPIPPPIPILRSALAAEQEASRFAAAGRRGVVLRLGLLDGPGTGNESPNPAMGATLHVDDAAEAMLAALTIPSGIYNVCRSGERVSNARFAATAHWRPHH